MEWNYDDLQTWIKDGCDEANGLNVTSLTISNNYLKSLPNEIFKLTNLLYFDCSFNELTSLPESIRQLVNLKTFYCSYNALIMLPNDIEKLTNLKYFYCEHNKLITLPQSITNLRKLVDIECYNKFAPLSPNIIRFIVKLNRPPRMRQQLCTNEQSAHNYDIQKYITELVQKILSINNEFMPFQLHFHISQNEMLTALAKELLLEYCNNKDVHTLLLITFEELLCYLYTFICNHEYKEKMFNIINLEISDDMCKCSMSRLSKLIDILVKISLLTF